MSASDVIADLLPILSDFSKAERRLHEVRMQKKEVYSVIIDTYDSVDYPVVRHTFYGRSEDEAFSYVAHHKTADKLLRDSAKGSYEGIKLKNTRPVVRKVPLSDIRASGMPKPSALPRDALKGELAKKIGA